MREVWKPVPGYGGHYEASSLGRIRVKDRVVLKRVKGKIARQEYKGRLLSPTPVDKYGHMSVSLGVDGKKYHVSAHTLVLLAFVGPRPDGMEACHNNGLAWDNRADNLRWDTHDENNKDRKRHGTYAVGSSHHCAKLTEAQAREIMEAEGTCKEIASKYGISPTVVGGIKSRTTWAHLKGERVPSSGRRYEHFRRGERAAQAKLTADQVLAIRSDNRSQDAIAAAYGIAQSSVSSIKLRKSWAHV